MKTNTQEQYIKRIDRVLSYLVAHLNEPLDLNRLADEACLSPYHFHRIYEAMTDESISDTVRRLRLQRAPGHLLVSNSTIPYVAKQAGYSGVQAIGRAFRNVYGVSPAKYRHNGGIALLQSDTRLKKESNTHPGHD